DTWDDFYQPVIDTAKRANARVIAANAPRDYVKRARTEGYEALAALPEEERALFALPEDDAPDTYRARFRDFMSGGGEREVDEARLEEVLRSQRLWDATMADSIATAWKDMPRGAKLVHLVGQFHSEYDGGLVSEIRARAPWARILTVTVQKGTAYALRAEDEGKADVVVYGTTTNPLWRSFNAAPIVPETTAAPVREEEMPTWGFAY
ncbi:MAG: ChaN family lipoprotein, partial [Phycisphaerales bacterium]